MIIIRREYLLDIYQYIDPIDLDGFHTYNLLLHVQLVGQFGDLLEGRLLVAHERPLQTGAYLRFDRGALLSSLADRLDARTNEIRRAAALNMRLAGDQCVMRLAVGDCVVVVQIQRGTIGADHVGVVQPSLKHRLQFQHVLEAQVQCLKPGREGN